ncbi:MAG: hypothetical protein ABL999_18560 [Pyrinomonadaceae bacterium]
MKLQFGLIVLALCIFVMPGFGQTELTIKKKTSMKFPGMPDMSGMPGGMADPTKGRTSTVYIKGGRMRTDSRYEQPKKMGGKESVTQTLIVQCDRKRSVSYNSKKKKYFVDPIAGHTSASTKNARKGGFVTVSGSVTDTGERAKLFGFDARHLKETYTMTPSKNACQKQTMKIEIEGWYADVPEFSCPAQRKPREFQMDNDCFDDVEFDVKGNGITGIALKEVKKMSIDGMTIIVEEEAISVAKTPIADSMFDPPADYKAANTLKEVEDDSPDDSTNATNPGTVVESSVATSEPSSTFAPPKAGLENPANGPKKPGMIRIGIARPKVTTPDTKKDPESGSDIAIAVTNSLVESLKADGVEAVALNTDFPENECAERQCDYVFHSTVVQKRGGGGMFGKMVAMGAISVAGAFIPGIGGMVASTIASQVMSQTMMKTAKAKDEFSLDYKLAGMDRTVVTQASVKKKTEKDGEDVLTPLILDASKSVLPKVKK